MVPVPLRVAGNLLWLNASRGVTVAATYTWADQSGTGDSNKNCSTVANQPAAPSADAGLNNKKSIAFDNSDILLSGTWAAAVVQPFTLVIIGYKPVTTAGSKYAFDSQNAGAQSALFSSSAIGTAVNAGSSITGNGEITAKSILICIFNGASSAVYINSSSATFTGNPGANGFASCTIGNTAGGGAFAGWNLADIMVYSGSLGASARTLLNGYATSEYGIVIV